MFRDRKTHDGTASLDVAIPEILPSYLRSLMNKAHIPAVSVATVINGKISQEIALGKTHVTNSSDNVTTHTVSEAASLSKAVFARVVQKLAREHIIDLDESLDKALPNVRLTNIEGAEKLTARRILSHQAGLDFGPDGEYEFIFEPGKEYRYSGVAYFYLQKVIEHRTKTSLESLARKYVFEPLKMHDSSFLRLKKFKTAAGHTAEDKPIDKGEGIVLIEGCDLIFMSTPPDKDALNELPIKSNAAYIRSGKKLFYIDKANKICSELDITTTTLESFDKILRPTQEARTLLASELQEVISITGHTQSEFSGCAAGSLLTTAHDYALFISDWMNDKDALQAFNPVVSMTKDKWAHKQLVSDEDLEKINWGLGWGLQTTDQGNIAFHWGDVGESKAFVAINLSKRTGIVYFSNSYNGLSIARDVVSPFVGNLNPTFNFLFQKYGYQHHDTNDWKKKQTIRPWHNFAKYEMHDKPRLIAHWFHNKLLTIDDNVHSRTLTINCDPKLTIFIKIIMNELEVFKYINGINDDGGVIRTKKTEQEQLQSLAIHISDRKLYDKFIKMLDTGQLLAPKWLDVSDSEMARSNFVRGTNTAKILLGKGTTTTTKLMGGALMPKFTDISDGHSSAMSTKNDEVLENKDESTVRDSGEPKKRASSSVYKVPSLKPPGCK